MNTLEEKKSNFDTLIKRNFSFLEKFNMTLQRTRMSGGIDPRDFCVITRYASSDFRFDIAWNEFELSLSILIKFFNNNNLSNYDCYAYFEALIEFLTEEEPIVPYIKEKSSISAIESVLDERAILFSQGLEPVLKKLAEKLQNNFEVLQSVSQEQLKNYHRWMLSEKISCKKTLAPRISQKGATF